MSLIIKKNTTFKIPRTPFLPSSLGGLSLWLKADAGTTTEAEQFISQIVISGAGTTTSNGTYTRASGGGTNFSGPNGNAILFDSVDGGSFLFQIYDDSFEGITYNILINYTTIISISIANGSPQEPTASTSLTTTGNTLVTAWADQSGNGNNASAPTINPTFIASAINSKPAISFNDDGSWMQIPENNIGNSGNITVFVVIDYTSGGVILNKGDGATFEATEWEMAPQNGFGYVRNDNGYFSWNVVAFTPSGLSLITMITTSGITELLNNDASEGTSSNATPINAISQYIGIGGGGASGSTQSSLDAKIAEIIIYNRAVTTAERQQVEAYLNSKYQIY